MPISNSLALQKERIRMPKTVNLGSKGSFEITRPGSLRAAAQKAGMSSKQFAQKKTKDPTWGSRARAALGLMGMGKH
jgi:hypothetical protein